MLENSFHFPQTRGRSRDLVKRRGHDGTTHHWYLDFYVVSSCIPLCFPQSQVHRKWILLFLSCRTCLLLHDYIQVNPYHNPYLPPSLWRRSCFGGMYKMCYVLSIYLSYRFSWVRPGRGSVARVMLSLQRCLKSSTNVYSWCFHVFSMDGPFICELLSDIPPIISAFLLVLTSKTSVRQLNNIGSLREEGIYSPGQR